MSNYNKEWAQQYYLDNKEYIKGNIQIISRKANRMKNNASIEELKEFARNILKHHPD